MNDQHTPANVPMQPKNKHAVALGRRGGYKRASRLSKEERKASAMRAVTARWAGHAKRDSAREQRGPVVANENGTVSHLTNPPDARSANPLPQDQGANE